MCKCVFAYVWLCLCVSKQSFSDLWPLTFYLYLLSALFSFCSAVGTELWKQRAVACTNSLGSLARLFNPFHHRLTLMSPAMLWQSHHHSGYTNVWHTHTRTRAHLSTLLSPSRACLMMLFGCTLAHPWPCALCPLSSFLPHSFLLLSLHRSQRGHRWLWAWKTRKRTPWGEVRHL